MKTVMKKIGCLLLVAVLMVGYLPFQAFADDSPYYEVITSDNAPVCKENLEAGVSYNVADLIPAGYEYDFGQYHFADGVAGLPDSFQLSAGEHALIVVKAAAHTHTPGAAATCTAPQTCKECGEVLNAALGHNWADATCTAPKTCTRCGATEGSAVGHNFVDGKCTYCGTSELCGLNGCTLAKGHAGEHNVKCTTANCALNLGHTGEHKCSCGLYLQVGSGHSTSCPYYESSANNSTLKIWATRYTGSVKKDTILLDTLTGLNKDTLIYQAIGANTGRINSLIDSGYGWSGHVYYEKDSKTVIDMNSKLTVGDTGNVYINLYSDQKLIVARVHTSKSYTVSRTIDINGFKVGQTVTSADVLNAVKKYYSVSSMTMYTPDQWSLIAQGKTANNIPNYTVHEGDNIIDVYVKGSSKSSSSTSTADSSNYKTGDAIYTPVIVLTTSVMALAAVLYLKKYATR